jgi:ABC-type branched-subunit amino acid transport system substrate-binding protein
MGFHALAAYDAVGAFLWAARAAAPTAAAPEELRKVIAVLRARAYPGALGMLRWDAAGDRVPSPYVIYAAKRGGSLHGWFAHVPPAASGSPQPGLFTKEASGKEGP